MHLVARGHQNAIKTPCEIYRRKHRPEKENQFVYFLRGTHGVPREGLGERLIWRVTEDLGDLILITADIIVLISADIENIYITRSHFGSSNFRMRAALWHDTHLCVGFLLLCAME